MPAFFTPKTRQLHISLTASLVFAFSFAVALHTPLMAAADPVMQIIEEAGQAGMAKNYKKAIELYSRALRSRPTDAGIYALRGKVLAMANDPSSAAKDFSMAILHDSEDMRNFYNRGMVYSKLNRLDEAIADFSVVVAANPEDYEALTQRADNLCKNDDFEGCVRDTNTVLEKHPDYAPAILLRGLARTHLHEYQLAKEDLIPYLRDTSKDNKSRVYAHMGLGKCYEGQGENDKAYAEFLQCAKLNPPVETLGHLGSHFQRAGAFDLAIQQYTKLIAFTPKDYSVYRDRGTTYSQKGEIEKAMADLNKSLQLNPNSPETWAQRGEIFRVRGNKKEALDSCLKALELDDSNAYVFNVFASLKLEFPDVDIKESALDLAKRACELSEWKNAVYLNTLALAYNKAGDYPNAHKYFQESMKHNPPSSLKTPEAAHLRAHVESRAAAAAQ